MERGDIAAVVTALFVVAILSFVVHLPPAETGISPVTPVPSPVPVAVTTPSPEPETGTFPQATTSPVPTTPPITPRRIRYTENYGLYPVRYIPRDMPMYGFSDVEWQYPGSVVFAYLDESHGGITELFSVPYPAFRFTCTLSAGKTPERADLRMLLVDAGNGLILEGAAIRYSGSVTRTVVAAKRPMYMVIGAENADRVLITLEVPSNTTA